MKDKIYDVIIIGGGAAGLFCAASYETPVSGLILEKTKATGKKLLMSGGGQCNLTHGGSIKDFTSHYGDKGKAIRSVLYQFNNQALMAFFESRGVPLFEREDGKVFPQSLDAKKVADTLRWEGRKNGFSVMYEEEVCGLEFDGSVYTVVCLGQDNISWEQGGRQRWGSQYKCKKLIVATGGCSYPITGSNGSMFQVLADFGLEIVPPRAALVPVYVEEYPYEELSGISFSPVEITMSSGVKKQDDLLFTHVNFSGPAMLNISRSLQRGDRFLVNYFPGKRTGEILADFKGQTPGNNKQAVTFFTEYFGGTAPKRFVERICKRAEIEANQKVSSLTGGQLKRMAELFTGDAFSVSRLGGFNTAMVTAGGIALEEINTKTMESKKYPGMFLIGEAVDVDGDTGGYNLQFAFSSGYLVGRNKG